MRSCSTLPAPLGSPSRKSAHELKRRSAGTGPFCRRVELPLNWNVPRAVWNVPPCGWKWFSCWFW